MQQNVPLTKLSSAELELNSSKDQRWLDHFEEGSYICANCGTPLFKSSAKFKSTKGNRPAFRESIGKVVNTTEDHSCGFPRKLIHCAKCNLYLGALFGDGADAGDSSSKAKDRYAVLSLCINFKSSSDNNTQEEQSQEKQKTPTKREKKKTPIKNPRRRRRTGRKRRN